MAIVHVDFRRAASLPHSLEQFHVNFDIHTYCTSGIAYRSTSNNPSRTSHCRCLIYVVLRSLIDGSSLVGFDGTYNQSWFLHATPMRVAEFEQPEHEKGPTVERQSWEISNVRRSECMLMLPAVLRLVRPTASISTYIRNTYIQRLLVTGDRGKLVPDVCFRRRCWSLQLPNVFLRRGRGCCCLVSLLLFWRLPTVQ